VEFSDGSYLRKFLDEVSSKQYQSFFLNLSKETDVFSPKSRFIYSPPFDCIRRIHLAIDMEKGKLDPPPYQMLCEIEELTGFNVKKIGDEIVNSTDLIRDSEDSSTESKMDKLILNWADETEFFRPLIEKLAEKYGITANFKFLFEKRTGFFSSEQVITVRNVAAQHPNNPLSEKDKLILETHAKSSKLVWDKLTPITVMKILSTFYHILGANMCVWKVPPKSIQDIWENFPENPTSSELSLTLDLLLSSRSWTDYVDYQDRKANLVNELKNGKIVTIYGEGATGKTELVYQALDELINTGAISFSHLLPITFKNDSQGEYSDSGDIQKVNLKGWDQKSKFHQILDLLSYKLPSPPDDGGDVDERMSRAVEFLIKYNVCLVIDNHETVGAMDPHKPLDAFLKKFSDHEDFVNSNSRIIITTRIRPDSTRTGKAIPMLYLNPQEMQELSKKRANWLAKRNNNYSFHIPLQAEDKSHWDDLNTWLETELQSELVKNFAGHPRVVFTAVFAAMFENPERKPLKEIIRGQISLATGGKSDENVLSGLMKYITSNSISYIPELERRHEAIANLAMLHSFNFEDLIEICEQHRIDYSVLIRNFEDLDLIRKTGEESYSFRTKYHSEELLEYIDEKYGLPQPPESKFEWWSKKLKLLKQRPLTWKTVQHLLVPPPPNVPSAIIQEQFAILSLTKLHPRNTVEIFTLLRQMCIILATLSKSETKYQLLGVTDQPSDLIANEESFRRFCAGTINNGLTGIEAHISESRSIKDDQFKRLTIILEDVDKVPFPDAIDGTYKQIQDQLDSLFSQVCQRSPAYSQETSVPLHNLWRISTEKDHPDVSLFNIGMRLLAKTGQNDARMIFDLFRYRICVSDALPEPCSSDIMNPLGLYLWNNKQLILVDSTKIMLDKLGEDSAQERIFSIFSGVLGNIQETNFGFSGVLDDGQVIHVATREKPQVNQIEARFQILNQEPSPDEEDVLILQCRLLAMKELLPEKHEQSISKSPEHSVSITVLTKNEMFTILNTIHFTEVAAANLFGSLLKKKLEEKGVTGSWKDWRKHHFSDKEEYKIDTIISQLSEGLWTVEYRSSGTAATIVRTKRKESEDENAGISEIINNHMSQSRTDFVQLDKTSRRKKSPLIAAKRGSPRRSNAVVKEEE